MSLLLLFGGDGTSTVSKSIDLRWSVEAGTVVGKSIDLRWAVRQLAGQDADLRWAVRQLVGQDADLRWAVRALAGQDADLRWAVRALGPLVPIDLRWSVQARVAKSRDLRWSVQAISVDVPVHSNPGREEEALVRVSASIFGNSVVNNGQTLLIVRNDDVDSHDVVVDSLYPEYGFPDVVVTAGPGAEVIVGPFSRALYGETLVLLADDPTGVLLSAVSAV